MRVSLIRGLLDSPSIIQYGDLILEGLGKYRPDIRVSEVRPPSPSLLPIGRIGRGIATQSIRYGWYPLRARRIHGNVCHVTDHVHAYLLNHLEAQRTIVTCHDLTTFVHPENITSTSLFPSITTRLFQHSIGVLHKAAYVVAISENTKRDILKYSQCTSDQVRVVYLGVSPIFNERADPEKLIGFRKKVAGDGSRLLLHVGLNTPYKNVESVIRVLGILRDTGQQVRLIKIGSEFTASQRELIRDLGLLDRITHLGKVAPAELVAAYQACDVLVFPSIYEGFGWPPLEAMACGTAVVASRTGAIPEVTGEAAILHEPTAVRELAQAVAGLLKNDDLRKRYIAAGLERAKMFTWERSISELASVYEDVDKLRVQRLG